MDNITGAWNVEATTNNQGQSFSGLITFFADGIMIANEPPGPGETTGHGNWISTGDDTIAYTFVSMVGDPGGKLKVVGTLQYKAVLKTGADPSRSTYLIPAVQFLSKTPGRSSSVASKSNRLTDPLFTVLKGMTAGSCPWCCAAQIHLYSFNPKNNFVSSSRCTPFIEQVYNSSNKSCIFEEYQDVQFARANIG